MKELLRFELYKLSRQPRVWLSFSVMLALFFLIYVGLALDGEKMLQAILKPLSSQFILEGNLINANLVAYLALNMLWVHIPILLIIVCGDLFSGELENGTIRLTLCTAVSRNQWLTAKVLAAAIYILVFMAFTGLMMILPGQWLFGGGDLLVLNRGVQVIEASQVGWRHVLALLFGTLGMFTFAILAIWISLWLRNSLAAILLSLGILILSTLIQTFGMGILESWRPFLFTWHMAQWQVLFVNEVPLHLLLQSAWVLSGHLIVFLGLAYWKFNRMNITE